MKRIAAAAGDSYFDLLDGELTLVTGRLVGVRALELRHLEGAPLADDTLAQIWQTSIPSELCVRNGSVLTDTCMYDQEVNPQLLRTRTEEALDQDWSIGDVLAMKRLELIHAMGVVAASQQPLNMMSELGSLKEDSYSGWICDQIISINHQLARRDREGLRPIEQADRSLTAMYLNSKVVDYGSGLERLIERLDTLRPAEDSSELPGGGRYISTSVSSDLAALRREADDRHPMAKRARSRTARANRRSGNPARRNGSSQPPRALAARRQPTSSAAPAPATPAADQLPIEMRATATVDRDERGDQQPFLGHSANQLRRLGVLGGRDSLGYRLQQFHDSGALDSDGLDIGRIIRVYTSLRALVIDTNGSTELAERRAMWQQEVAASTDSVDKELGWLGDHWPHVVAAIDRSKHKMHVTNEQLAALAEVLGVREEDLVVSLDSIPPTSSRRGRKRVRPAPAQHEEPQHETNGDTPAQQECVVRLRSGGDLGDYLEKLCKNQSNHLRPTLERVIGVLAKRVSSENSSRAGIKKMRAIKLASGPCARELPLFEFKPSEARLGSEINTSVVRRWRILYTVERDANDRLVIGIHEVVHRNMLDDQARRVYQGV